MAAKDKVEAAIAFDHHCPVSLRDPDEAYLDLLENDPVAWTEAHGGYWIVTRHEDVLRVLRDYRYFSSRDGMAIPAHAGGDYGIPVKLDPPEHGPYRRAMNPFMTKEAVQDLLPRLHFWTNHYLDRIVEKGACDFAYDVAVPIPGAITLEWVGWEAQDEWDRISEAWHDLLAYPLNHARTLRSHANLAWFTVRIGEELEMRRRAPREDILTYVADLEVDGRKITQEQAVSMATIWVAGGVDTATTFILAGLLHLHRDRHHRKQFIERPELWDSAMEEILRRYPPTRTTTRTVVNDVEIGNCLMKAGDRVLVSLSAANLDPAAFDRPEEVLLERSPNQHMAFGMGAHRCVGMHLARQEFKVIVGQVLARMPDFTVDEDRMAVYQRQSEMRGWTSMPATFTPGPRLSAAPPADM